MKKMQTHNLGYQWVYSTSKVHLQHLTFMVGKVAAGVTSLDDWGVGRGVGRGVGWVLLYVGGGEGNLVDFFFPLSPYPPVQVNVLTLAKLVLCSILQLFTHTHMCRALSTHHILIHSLTSSMHSSYFLSTAMSNAVWP